MPQSTTHGGFNRHSRIADPVGPDPPSLEVRLRLGGGLHLAFLATDRRSRRDYRQHPRFAGLDPKGIDRDRMRWPSSAWCRSEPMMKRGVARWAIQHRLECQQFQVNSLARVNLIPLFINKLSTIYDAATKYFVATNDFSENSRAGGRQSGAHSGPRRLDGISFNGGSRFNKDFGAAEEAETPGIRAVEIRAKGGGSGAAGCLGRVVKPWVCDRGERPRYRAGSLQHPARDDEKRFDTRRERALCAACAGHSP